ncbi:hypothetical protein SEVIR_3G219200v4 [Setaria viridis]
MSCFPCFGGGKSKNDDADAEGPDAPATASNMTPPPMVQAPAAYSPAPAASAAPSAAAPPKPGGANNADPSSVDDASLRAAITAQAFAFRELAAATDHFTPYNLVGEGGFFRVYKGKLEKSGQTVAIKQLDKHGFQDNKAFLTGVAKLSQLHHENLVDIVGYCADGDQRLLVYESVPAGTLEDHLYDLSAGKKPMDWCTRMKVAYGAAQGLEYLHEKASPMMGSFGCAAPEYDRSGQATMKSDVYSFGVVLVQLISGRRAVDTSKPVAEQNVVTWAMPMFKDQKRYHELVDPLIKTEYPAKALNQVVAMAAMCLQEEDSVRPLMADVVMTLGFLTSMPPDPPAPVAPPATAPEPKKDKGRSDDHSDSSSESSDDDEGNEDEEEEEEADELYTSRSRSNDTSR